MGESNLLVIRAGQPVTGYLPREGCVCPEAPKQSLGAKYRDNVEYRNEVTAHLYMVIDKEVKYLTLLPKFAWLWRAVYND